MSPHDPTRTPRPGPRQRGRTVIRLIATTVATALTVTAIAAPPAHAEASLSLGQTVLGNVFVDDHTAEFTVTTAETPQVRWTVSDEHGVILHSAVQPTSSGRIAVPELPDGQYRLVAEGVRNQEIINTAETTFAIIPSWSGPRDSRFGVNPKFGLPEVAPTWDAETHTWADEGVPLMSTDIMPLLAQTGVASVRENLPWNNLEVEDGYWSPGPSWYQGYLDALDGIGVRSNILLTYGNKFHDVDGEGIGAFPNTAAGRAAFAEYARRVITRPGSDIDTVEVWNEPNSNAPWNRGPCADDPDTGNPQPVAVKARCYYELLKVVSPVVKEARPNARVTGPAGVTIPYGYLEELFKLGGLKYLDAVTIHPYGFPQTPEAGYCLSPDDCGLATRIDQVRDLIRKYNDGEDKPIWFTEIGWGSYTGSTRGVTEQQQADYMVRAHLIAFAHGVDHIDWYSMMNAKVLPDGPGANWGLVRHPGDPLGTYTPKESFTAYTTMTRQLSGRAFVGADPSPHQTYSYRFASPDRKLAPTRVMWAGSGTRTVILTAKGKVTVTDRDGTPLLTVDKAKKITLALDGAPVYVHGDVRSIQ